MSENSFSINNSTSVIRKIRKPLMEKKRRARINDSLEELKEILLKNTVAITYGQRPTKLEKADILEMTVRYLNTLHKRLATQRTLINNSNRDCGVSSTTTSTESKKRSFGGDCSYALSKNNCNFQQRIVPVKIESDDKENMEPHAGATWSKSGPKSFASSSKSAFTAIHPNFEYKTRRHLVDEADDPWRPW